MRVRRCRGGKKKMVAAAATTAEVDWGGGGRNVLDRSIKYWILLKNVRFFVAF